MISMPIITKGHNSAKLEGGLAVPAFCTLYGGCLYFTKLHETIFDGFNIIERTRSSYKKFQKRHISGKIKVE